MQTIDINKKLVDGYLELLKNLSLGNKLDLIARLSDSIKANSKEIPVSLKLLGTDFIPEKTAGEIIEELKKSRNFARETESF